MYIFVCFYYIFQHYNVLVISDFSGWFWVKRKSSQTLTSACLQNLFFFNFALGRRAAARQPPPPYSWVRHCLQLRLCISFFSHMWHMSSLSCPHSLDHPNVTQIQVKIKIIFKTFGFRSLSERLISQDVKERKQKESYRNMEKPKRLI